MSLPSCYVCNQPGCAPLYRSQSGRSLSSLGQIHSVSVAVYACERCGHCQSDVLDDVSGYYDSQYNILVDSEEEDQIYVVEDGVRVYRTEHQVRTLLGKLPLEGELNLLDYGCAKSSTIRALCDRRLGITPHLFDVSERYIPFWQKFTKPEHWAVNTPKLEWNSYFDVVTSFFSLEHIPTPAATLKEIAGLLKPGGIFYGIVPNVLTNIADLIVIDHCNHFTNPSLAQVIASAGLEVLEIDAESHRGAFVIVAAKPTVGAPSVSPANDSELSHTLSSLDRVANFWSGAAGRLHEFERDLPRAEPIAIYGAGFYGAFIAANLMHPDRITCFVDQNPFLQGRSLEGKPIVAPEDLPSQVETMLIGLNPAHARRIVDDVPALTERGLNFFFL